eukprot:352629-Chlamydomonas_euryale.AAC.3
MERLSGLGRALGLQMDAPRLRSLGCGPRQCHNAVRQRKRCTRHATGPLPLQECSEALAVKGLAESKMHHA